MKLKRFEDDMDINIWDTTIHNNIIIPKDKRKKITYKFLLSILSISIVILATFIIFFMYFGSPNKSTFEKYYTSENIVDITRGHNTFDAIQNFQEKDFQTASTLFNEILKEDPLNISIRFYYGISCIETKDYNKSIESFQYIINDNNNLYIEHAQWYLGLCYLKIGENDKAIKEFEKISLDPDNYYQDKSKKILTEIK